MKEELRIWAPHARQLAVEAEGEVRTATRSDDGYWTVRAPAPGHDYMLVVDGRRVPDPRSQWQPRGVRGPSQRVSHDFAWNDADFRATPLSAGLLYELHVGTFSSEGTYRGASRRLEYLRDLGVTHIELMPLAAFPGRRGWGYDGVALHAPHAGYGTPDDLKRFVARCHALGLAVILDVVYNHVGPGSSLAALGPYFSERCRTAWGPAVNLDGPGSDEVRAFFLDSVRMWLRDYHFDGLRVDAVHAFHDQSARPFLEELTCEVRALEAVLGRPLVAIAESDLNDPRLVRGADQGGLGFDAQWSDDFHHALHALLTGERAGYYADFGALEQLARALVDGFVYTGSRSPFRQRRHGQPLGDLPGDRLVAYLQNHDQIGNRARGERIGQLVSPGLARIGAALVFVSPFVPMLFQGEEWGARAPFAYFTDHEDPELALAVRRGRREEFAAFGWRAEDVLDPQAESSHLASVLDWSELEREPHRSLHAWYRALIRLRAEVPELRDGRRDRLRIDHDAQARWIRVQRGPVTLLANLGKQAVDLAAPAGGRVLGDIENLNIGAGRVVLPPESCCIHLRS